MTAHPKKIESVLRLDAQTRCDYFIRKVADFETVWGLFDTGWATASANGHIAIPFWPEEDFADACASEEWKNFRAKAISLEEFLSRWLPGMDSDRRICAVFPAPGDKGLLVPPIDLMNLIKQELQQYE
ncbi:hypothetical protein WS75_30070 [Burkholderia sp. FL-7-2-10-S1-D7]|jgi:hypothetical protein|uniref:DUF2750 domain-containing protein n=1 Tax=Burkholderia sp. FL-7-2-10-S1-D7 TaxID=1637866 RepID=UPI00075CADED|nr:DUF2750 domain-containing protein [Burkholderia sp. FL-7-2-10-S1-D7]KVF68041.1 hypothetical protein WS75_30070 [Burkholderia sp. FL-7-2-10-S1-D7]